MKHILILGAVGLAALPLWRTRSTAVGDEKKSSADQAFIRAADEINVGEIALGKTAKENAANPAVKLFGERMHKDHAQLNKEVRELAAKKGVALPDRLDAKHQALLDQLSKLKGADFDRAFAKDMVSGHEKAVAQFEDEAKNGKDADVKAWAEKSLPTLREHLKLARDTVSAVSREK